MKTLEEVISDALGCKHQEVVDAATFQSLGADSLDEVQLSIEIEDVFDVSIDDWEAANCRTVGQARMLVMSKVAAKGGDSLALLRAGIITLNQAIAEPHKDFAAGCDGGPGRASIKKSHRAEGNNFVD